MNPPKISNPVAVSKSKRLQVQAVHQFYLKAWKTCWSVKFLIKINLQNILTSPTLTADARHFDHTVR